MEDVLLSKSTVHLARCFTACRESRCNSDQRLGRAYLPIPRSQSFEWTLGVVCGEMVGTPNWHVIEHWTCLPNSLSRDKIRHDKEAATQTWCQAQQAQRCLRKLNRLHHIRPMDLNLTR